MESLVISGWVRGLSDRDIEVALAEVFGPELRCRARRCRVAASASATSCKAWHTRDLSSVHLDFNRRLRRLPRRPDEPRSSSTTRPRTRPTWRVIAGGDAQHGDEAVAVTQRQAGEFATKWKSRYRFAVACVTDDLASLTVHLRFPAEHWRSIRHANILARTGETRPRVKVTREVQKFTREGHRVVPRREFVPVPGMGRS
jgi:hypothetical protein